MSKRIVIELCKKQKKKLRRMTQCTTDGALRMRCLIVPLCAEGLGAKRIAATLHCAVSTPARVGGRFARFGEVGLFDGRHEPKATKVTA